MLCLRQCQSDVEWPVISYVTTGRRYMGHIQRDNDHTVGRQQRQPAVSTGSFWGGSGLVFRGYGNTTLPPFSFQKLRIKPTKVGLPKINMIPNLWRPRLYMSLGYATLRGRMRDQGYPQKLPELVQGRLERAVVEYSRAALSKCGLEAGKRDVVFGGKGSIWSAAQY